MHPIEIGTWDKIIPIGKPAGNGTFQALYNQAT